MSSFSENESSSFSSDNENNVITYSTFKENEMLNLMDHFERISYLNQLSNFLSRNKNCAKLIKYGSGDINTDKSKNTEEDYENISIGFISVTELPLPKNLIAPLRNKTIKLLDYHKVNESDCNLIVRMSVLPLNLLEDLLEFKSEIRNKKYLVLIADLEVSNFDKNNSSVKELCDTLLEETFADIIGIMVGFDVFEDKCVILVESERLFKLGYKN